MKRSLGRRAVNSLIKGTHAKFGGTTLAMRSRRIEEIAVSFSVNELLAEPGIGEVTAVEIESWLKNRGLFLRPVPGVYGS
jgi:hypothetical protein